MTLVVKLEQSIAYKHRFRFSNSANPAVLLESHSLLAETYLTSPFMNSDVSLRTLYHI